MLLLLEHKAIYGWFRFNTIYSFKDIFGDTRAPIVLNGKTHIFEYIAKENEIPFFSANYTLIKFFEVDDIFFYVAGHGCPYRSHGQNVREYCCLGRNFLF